MIAIRISGGLGNQMFQYALGRRLSIEYNSPLFLDLREYECHENEYYRNNGVANRKYELNIFNLGEHQHILSDNFNLLPKNTIGSRLQFKIEKLLGIRAVIFEKGLGYDADIIKQIKKVNYLSGYWQSPKYFEGIDNVLRSEFEFNLGDFRDNSLEMIIESSNSIAVHIRRGDYVNSPIINATHGVSDLSYYKKAYDVINEIVPSPTFFIFSDDISWAKDNLRWLPNTFYVSKAAWPNYYEMFLMSRCKHQIIANSTFSWWAAWLNKFIGKVIIAPAKWYADKHLNNQFSTIIPNGWKRL